MNASVAIQKKRKKNCTGRYSEGKRNENGEHLVSPCESSNFGTKALYSHKELART